MPLHGREGSVRRILCCFLPLPTRHISPDELAGSVRVWAMAKKLGRFLGGSASAGEKVAVTVRKGLADGIGGAALIIAGDKKSLPRRYAGRGIGGDWNVVGSTLRRAMETRG